MPQRRRRSKAEILETPIAEWDTLTEAERAIAIEHVRSTITRVVPPPERPSDTLARRVREVRGAKGISQRELAKRCAEIGDTTLNRDVIASIETKRRRVSVDELFVLAHALDVAPVHLVVPIDGSHSVKLGEISASHELGVSRAALIPAPAAREWARGLLPLHSTDARTYMSEVPDHEWGETERDNYRSMPEKWMRQATESGAAWRKRQKGSD